MWFSPSAQTDVDNSIGRRIASDTTIEDGQNVENGYVVEVYFLQLPTETEVLCIVISIEIARSETSNVVRRQFHQ